MTESHTDPPGGTPIAHGAAPPASGRPSQRPALLLAVVGALLVLVATVLPQSAQAVDVGPGSTASVANVPYSSLSGGCDESRDGWHIVMNGVETSDGEPATAADFGPIALTFSDASTGSAVFTDMSGPVAHFLDAVTNQSGEFTLTSATMTFPAGSRVTAYNNFRISHPPCGTVTTTSTNPVSTETTSTTGPVSTETTSTTSPVSTASTATTREGAIVAAADAGGQSGGGTSGGTAGRSGSSLPDTGLDGLPFVIAGSLLMASGAALWVVRRRQATA